jgi:hypothetical protein
MILVTLYSANTVLYRLLTILQLYTHSWIAVHYEARQPYQNQIIKQTQT